MSRSATTLLVWSYYLLGMGTLLVVVPDLLLALFGFAPASDVWVRVVGVLALLLAWFYLLAARNDLKPFTRGSVSGRAAVFLFFVLFVVLGMAPMQLILFGLVDLTGAAWTWQALRSEG